MKTIILICLVALSASCRSQNLTQGCWIPKKFVDSLQTNPFKSYSNLIQPLQSVLIMDDKILMMSYQSEYMLAETRRVNDNTVEVTNFSNLINLSYPDAVLFTRKKCFITSKGDSLFLRFEKGQDIQVVKFIKGLDDAMFENFNETTFRLSLTGSYFFDKEKIVIDFNGDIRGSDQWTTYKVLRRGSVSINNKKQIFNLVSFGKQTRETFAVQIYKDELHLYSFNGLDTSDYLIQTLESPKYILKRTDQ